MYRSECFISLSLISCNKEQWQNYGQNTITMSNILYHIEKPQKRFTQKLELSHFYRIESLRDRLAHNYAKVKRKSNSQCYNTRTDFNIYILMIKYAVC